MIQFTVCSDNEKNGCIVLFEWNSKWSITASPTRMTIDEDPTPTDFFLQLDWELNNIVVEAHETLEIPAVHIIYSHDATWDPFTHDPVCAERGGVQDERHCLADARFL
jgi:hypothetical protein